MLAAKRTQGFIFLFFSDDMLREIGLMYALRGNVHIVHLVAHAFIDDDTPVAVLEYCSKGDLRSFILEQLPEYKPNVSSASFNGLDAL